MGAVAFKDLITFARASGGGRFNASGQYEWLPANQPRINYDPVTGEAKGLLIEEQRTRLNTVSTGATLFQPPTRATYVDDGTLFIDNTTPFRKLVESTDTGSHFCLPFGVSLVANTTYTASYIVRAAGRTKFRLDATSTASWAISNPYVEYDLDAATAIGRSGASGTIRPLGNGVFRVTWTATTGAASFNSAIYAILQDDSGATSYTGDGVSGIYISGYQIEAGSFATSLIVGEGAQVTRAADVPSVNVLSPWFNASEGTFVVEWVQPALKANGQQSVFDLNDGTTNNRLAGLIESNSSIFQSRYASGGVWTPNKSAPAAPPGLRCKAALAYASGDQSFAFGGSVFGSGTTIGGLGAVSSMRVGNGLTGALNSHIRSIRYYPKRLSNSELQVMTA